MRNTTVVLLGDSNQRLWWRKITHFFLHCTSVFSQGQWHSPRLCLVTTITIAILCVCVRACVSARGRVCVCVCVCVRA